MNDQTRQEEERFVDFLTNTARESYNPPPETPRDEMWAVIQADRAVEREERKVVAIHRHRSLWWIGVAAALVIGVGLGRISLRGPVDEASMVMADSEVPSAGVSAPAGAPGDVPRADEPEAEPSAADVADAQVEQTAPAGTRLADAGDAPTTDAPAARSRSTLPYRVAAADLLTRSETFLTMFKTDGADEELRDQFANWARTLLMQTRLMIDSPAGEDPQMRALLEDLELALVQIVHLGDAADEEEAKRIGEGLDDGQLLFKLRSLPDPKTVGT